MFSLAYNSSGAERMNLSSDRSSLVVSCVRTPETGCAPKSTEMRLLEPRAQTRETQSERKRKIHVGRGREISMCFDTCASACGRRVKPLTAPAQMLSFFSLFWFELLYSAPNGSSIYGASLSPSFSQQEFGDFRACGVGKSRSRGLFARRRETLFPAYCVCWWEKERENEKDLLARRKNALENSPAAALSLLQRVALIHNGTRGSAVVELVQQLFRRVQIWRVRSEGEEIPTWVVRLHCIIHPIFKISI